MATLHLFHYVPIERYAVYEAARKIQLTDILRGHYRLVWLTTAENSLVAMDDFLSNEMLDCDPHRFEDTHGELVRIAVDAAVANIHDWEKLRKRFELPSRLGDLMEIGALQGGLDLERSCATFEAVPREQWMAVDVYQGDEWLPLDHEKNQEHLVNARTTAFVAACRDADLVVAHVGARKYVVYRRQPLPEGDANPKTLDVTLVHEGQLAELSGFVSAANTDAPVLEDGNSDVLQ